MKTKLTNNRGKRIYVTCILKPRLQNTNINKDQLCWTGNRPNITHKQAFNDKLRQISKSNQCSLSSLADFTERAYRKALEIIIIIKTIYLLWSCKYCHSLSRSLPKCIAVILRETDSFAKSENVFVSVALFIWVLEGGKKVGEMLFGRVVPFSDEFLLIESYKSFLPVKMVTNLQSVAILKRCWPLWCQHYLRQDISPWINAQNSD